MNLSRAALALLLTSALTLRADEVEDALNTALKHYKEGKLSEASTEMQKAMVALNEKQGLTISAVLPDMIGEWRGLKLESSSLAGLGGGSSVERSYKKGERKATVSIIADSPMLKQVADFISNPALGGLLGIKSRKVGDAQAMVQGKEGMLQMAAGSRYMVTVQGKKLSEEELVDLASGVKVDVLKLMK